MSKLIFRLFASLLFANLAASSIAPAIAQDAAIGNLAITGAPATSTIGDTTAFTPTISGGVPPYRLTLSKGALPPGRSISGLSITGTFADVGSFPYTLRTTDIRGQSSYLNVVETVNPIALGPTTFNIAPGTPEGTWLGYVTGLAPGDTIATIRPNDGRVRPNGLRNALRVGASPQAGSFNLTITTSFGRSFQANVTTTASYLGVVATQGRLADQLDTADNSANSVSPHYLRDAVAAGTLKVLFPGWWWDRLGTVASKQERSLGAITYTATIEYNGTRYPVTCGGVSTCSVNGLTELESDPVANLSAPSGSLLLAHIFMQASGGVPWTALVDTAAGGVLEQGTNLTDKTVTGTPAQTTVTRGFFPLALLAPTRKASILATGDSIQWSFNDDYSAGNHDTGFQRAYGSTLAYIDAGSYGDTSVAFLSSSARRIALKRYVTAVINNIGVNDISVTPINTLLANRATIAAAFSDKQYFQHTITPKTIDTVAISSLTSSGTTATAVVPSTQAAALVVGNKMTIAGATPSGYNGSVTILTVSGQNVTYTLPNSGTGLAAASVTGTMSDNGVSLAFQSPFNASFAGGSSDRITYNTAIRLLPNYIEVADFFESARDSGLWKPSTNGANSGVYTLDFLHPWKGSWILFGSAGIPNVSVFTPISFGYDLPKPANDDAIIEKLAA